MDCFFIPFCRLCADFDRNPKGNRPFFGDSGRNGGNHPSLFELSFRCLCHCAVTVIPDDMLHGGVFVPGGQIPEEGGGGGNGRGGEGRGGDGGQKKSDGLAVLLSMGCNHRNRLIGGSGTGLPEGTIGKAVRAHAGGLAGASVARESILGFMQYLIPALILNVLIIGGSLLLAKILIKYTGWDKATCILSCCPAGLSPTIMVAMEYGADANIVTVFQVLRMVTVLIVTPFAAVLIL